jgi:hypothetical protein
VRERRPFSGGATSARHSFKLVRQNAAGARPKLAASYSIVAHGVGSGRIAERGAEGFTDGDGGLARIDPCVSQRGDIHRLAAAGREH